MPSPSDQDEKSTLKGDKSLEGRFGQLKEQMDTIQKTKANEPSNQAGSSMGKAMRMGTEFVVAVLVGAFLGWQFDTWFDTKPLWLILFMLLGFGAGINNVLRLTKKEQQADETSETGDNQ
jgi:ATP synthase protein I